MSITFTVKPDGSIEPYDPWAIMQAAAAPPVVDITGDQNAARADKAAYLVEGYCGADDDPTCDIVDVLTDIRHLCTVCGYDFDELLACSEQHWSAEQHGDD